MKIVVIGGTGLIGSKTVAILRQGGHEDGRGLAAPTPDAVGWGRAVVEAVAPSAYPYEV